MTGLYIHVPFCVRKCPYCDFYSLPLPDDSVLDAYTDEVCRRLAAHVTTPCDTLYFGGGTPSLLGGKRLARIIRTARKQGLTDTAEITLEANPAESLYDTFAAGSGTDFSSVSYLILAYAALPAICEEFVFRGVLCATLEERGLLPAIAYSSLAFGMLHFEFSHLPVYIFAGLLLCAVMYATRSLIATVILHFAYNLFGLFGQPTLTQFYLYTGSTELFSFLLLLILLVSAIVFCGEASRAYRSYARTMQGAPYRVDLPRSEWGRRLIHTVFAPVSIVCMVVYLLACLFI